MTAAAAPGGRGRLVAAVRRSYVAVLAVVLVAALWASRGDLSRLVDGTRPWPLLAALGLTAAQLVLSAAFWAAALRTMGAPAGTGRILAATARSLPARYLPGSVWYPLGRAALLHAEGVRRAPLAVVAVLEALLSVPVAFLLGALVLATGGRTGAAGVALPGGLGAVVAACALVLAAISPPVLTPVVRLVARRRAPAADQAPDLAPVITWPAWAALVGAMAAFHALSALAFAVYLRAFPALDAVAAGWAVAGAFLVAWALGFLAVFAPQGLGVFEVTVALLLVGRPNPELAVVVAAFRALVGVRDVIAFGVDAAWRAARRGGSPGSARTG